MRGGQGAGQQSITLDKQPLKYSYYSIVAQSRPVSTEEEHKQVFDLQKEQKHNGLNDVAFRCSYSNSEVLRCVTPSHGVQKSTKQTSHHVTCVL